MEAFSIRRWGHLVPSLRAIARCAGPFERQATHTMASNGKTVIPLHKLRRRWQTAVSAKPDKRSAQYRKSQPVEQVAADHGTCRRPWPDRLQGRVADCDPAAAALAADLAGTQDRRAHPAADGADARGVARAAAAGGGRDQALDQRGPHPGRGRPLPVQTGADPGARPALCGVRRDPLRRKRLGPRSPRSRSTSPT